VLLVGRQERLPACKKTDWWDAGVVICLVKVQIQTSGKEMKRNECEILTSESVCRKVFNTQFNVQFHKPKKDTCIKCAGYHMQISA